MSGNDVGFIATTIWLAALFSTLGDIAIPATAGGLGGAIISWIIFYRKL